MIEPVSASAFGLGVFGNFLKNCIETISAGGEAHHAYRHLIGHLKERLNDGRVPANHDLNNAIEQSLLEAARAFALGVAAQLDPQPTLFEAIGHHLRDFKFDQPLLDMLKVPGRDWVEELLKESRRAHGEHGIEAEFILDENEVTKLLVDRAPDKFQQRVNKAFADWLERHVQNAAKPDCVNDFLTKGWPVEKDSNKRITFYQAFCLFFHEKVKHRPEVVNILLAQTLSNVAENQKALETLPEQVANILKKLNEQKLASFDHFQNWLGDQFAQLKIWLEAKFEKVYAGQAETNRLVTEVKELLQPGSLKEEAEDDKKIVAERRWQYIQNHPIRGVEILFMLKGPVGFDWFCELLKETRLTFSRDEPSFKLSQLLAVSYEPNTKEPSPKMEKPVCSFWEIYEPEKGYWFKKIAPNPRTFSTTAGFDATAPWSVLGVKRVEKLQDIGMLTEVGISIPARAYQVGVEEFRLRFIGDTFSFSVKLSDHALEAMHSLGRGFASFQKSRAADDEPIPVGTSFGGVELLEMFHRQLLPRPKNEKAKLGSVFGGQAGPGGKAISFYPSMPMGFNKLPESKEYTFTITVPSKTDFAPRIKELEEKLKSNPPEADPYGELAAIYSHEGRLQDAIRCLETAIKQAPPNADVLGLMGQTLMKLGRFAEAVAHLQKSAALNPKNVMVQTKLGICFSELNNNEAALVHFKTAAEMMPSDAGHQVNLSMAFAAVNRYSEALAPAERAVELDPKDHRAAMHLGVLLSIKKQTTEAIRYFEKAAQLAPNDADAHEILGQHLAKTHQHEKAVVSLERAVKIQASAMRYDLLGASLGELDRWPEAEAAFRRAVELEPNDSARLTKLGATIANCGKFVEAAQLLEQSLRINPNNKTAKQYLARVQKHLRG